MKSFLLGLFCLMFAGTAHAGLITYTVLSSDAGVSYSHFNDSFSDIYDEFDGEIESVNIKDGSLDDDDLNTATSVVTRSSENIGSYTYEGMLPSAAGSTLTTNISAGTSYVVGERVVTAATSKTYTASRDTYVYINSSGAFVYQEVALGGSQPSDPTYSLLLAKAVTDGTDVTSVTDLRTTTPPNLRIYQSYIFGCSVSRDVVDTNKIVIGSGEVEFGPTVENGKRRNTGTAAIDFSSGGIGGLQSGLSQAADTYYYLFAIADPDNSSNFKGIASTSSSDVTGVTGERLIGWCYSETTSKISEDSVGAFKGLGASAPNVAKIFWNNDITITDTSHEDLPGVSVKFISSGRPVMINSSVKYQNSSAGTVGYFAVSIDGAACEGSEVASEGAANVWDSASMSYLTALDPGEHDIVIRAKVSGSTGKVKDRGIIVQEL